MTDNNENLENLENENLDPENQENLENGSEIPENSDNPENQELGNDTENLETGSETPENQEIPEEPEPQEPEPQPNPWDDAPENVYFYEKMYPDGHLGSFTRSAELAYKSGWNLENYIAISETQQSDINGWTYRKSECPMKGLTEKKQDKLRELSRYADRFEQNKCDEMYVTSSLGFRANADRRSLQNVSNLIDIGEATQFKDYDDQFHLLGVQDLETLAMEIKKNGANLYSQKFTMQYQISNCQTEQELENFVFQFTMLDFSNGV
jgi:hypothetical protein